MADDIGATLECLAGNAKGIEQLAKSLEKLADAKKDAFSAGDVSSLLAYSKVEKSIKKLMTTTEQYTKAQEDLQTAQKEGRTLTEDELENLEKISTEHKTATKVVEGYAKAQVASHESQREEMDKTRAKATEYWKTNTLMGKSFTAMTGGLAQMTAGLTVAGLAYKMFARHAQAAELRQNILIQSYQGFDKTIVGAQPGLAGYSKHLLGLDSIGVRVAADTLKFSDVMAHTEATANRMGVSTEYVTDSMQKFSRITGVTTPEVLGKLTEGAITVSRAMGITVPEAVDFVSLRMDKFGGSAAGAIVSLNQIRLDTEKVNTMFGRTVIRADDVVRTLMDISRQTNIYAIDQRYVGNILRDSIAKLQSTGDSYDTANKKATAFTKAVTGQAPEWMQVYAGQDILGTLMKGFNGQALNTEMTKELEAAKPGLAKEIEKILGDKNMGYYSKMRLVQEMTSGTTLGVEAMNKQIIKLANNPQGVVIIAKQFGVTLAEAQGIVDQAKNMQKETEELNSLMKLPAKELANQLHISEDEAKILNDTNLSEIERKGNLKEILDLRKKEDTKKADVERLKTQKIMNDAAIANTNKTIQMWQSRLDEAKKTGSEEQIETATTMIEKGRAELSRYEEKERKGVAESEGLKTISGITATLVDQFRGYAISSGGEFKAWASELSSTKLLMAGLATFVVVKYFNWHKKAYDLIQKTLLDIAMNTGGKGGGAGAGAGAATGPAAGEYGPFETPEQKAKREKKLEKEDAKASKIKEKEENKHTKLQEREDKKRVKQSYTEHMEHLKSIKKTDSVFGRLGKTVTGAAGAIKHHVTTYEEGPGSLSKLGKHAGAAGIAMNVATQLFGDSLETSSGDLKKVNESFVGTANKVAEGLALIPGPVGLLAGSFQTGVAIGNFLNKGLDSVGLSSERVGGWMADLVATDGPFQKVYEFFGGKEATNLANAQKKLVDSAAKWGLSVKDLQDAEEKAKAKHMSTVQYLQSIGKTRAGGLPPATAPVPTTTTKVTPMAKETVRAGAPISPTTAAALNLPPVDPYLMTPEMEQAFGVPSNVSTAPRIATTPPAAAAAPPPQAAAAASNTPYAASVVGGIQGDGSITLRVDNFMNTAVQAQNLMKQKGPRQTYG